MPGGLSVRMRGPPTWPNGSRSEWRDYGIDCEVRIAELEAENTLLCGDAERAHAFISERGLFNEFTAWINARHAAERLAQINQK